MKYIKQYEEKDYIPHVGDYVLCHTESDTKDKDTFNHTIGYFDRMFSSYYVIRFDKKQEMKQGNRIYAKNDLDKIYLYAYKYEVIYWSKNKEELELILTANKFNL